MVSTILQDLDKPVNCYAGECVMNINLDLLKPVIWGVFVVGGTKHLSLSKDA